MNRDLFMAILAMDSYNRGYSQGLLLNANDAINGQDELGRNLGSATIIADNTTSTAQSSGFYAIAYDWNGQTIISYRGTDNILALNSDVLFGWPTGGGFFHAQVGLAVDFFNSVAQQVTPGGDPRLAPISLTGHSLSGGLAANDNVKYIRATA